MNAANQFSDASVYVKDTGDGTVCVTVSDAPEMFCNWVIRSATSVRNNVPSYLRFTAPASSVADIEELGAVFGIRVHCLRAAHDFEAEDEEDEDEPEPRPKRKRKSQRDSKGRFSSGKGGKTVRPKVPKKTKPEPKLKPEPAPKQETREHYGRFFRDRNGRWNFKFF